MKANHKILAMYIVSLVLGGSNGIMASFIELSSYEIVFLRTIIGSVILGIIMAGMKVCRKNREAIVFGTRQAFFLILSGAVMGAGWMFLYEAYVRIGVGISTLIYYCGPIIVMAAAPLLFKERLTVTRVFCFLVVLCGMVLVSGDIFGERTDFYGLICALIGAIMYAVMIICNKKAHAASGLASSLVQLVTAFAVVAVFVGMKQGVRIDIPQTSIAPVIVLGVLNTGFGCYLYFSSVGKLPAQTAAMCGYVEPLSAVLLSTAFLGEILLPLQIVGVAFVIGGAVFGNWIQSKPRQTRKQAWKQTQVQTQMQAWRQSRKQTRKQTQQQNPSPTSSAFDASIVGDKIE